VLEKEARAQKRAREGKEGSKACSKGSEGSKACSKEREGSKARSKRGRVRKRTTLHIAFIIIIISTIYSFIFILSLHYSSRPFPFSFKLRSYVYAGVYTIHFGFCKKISNVSALSEKESSSITYSFNA